MNLYKVTFIYGEGHLFQTEFEGPDHGFAVKTLNSMLESTPHTKIRNVRLWHIATRIDDGYYEIARYSK